MLEQFFSFFFIFVPLFFNYIRLFFLLHFCSLLTLCLELCDLNNAADSHLPFDSVLRSLPRYPLRFARARFVKTSLRIPAGLSIHLRSKFGTCDGSGPKIIRNINQIRRQTLWEFLHSVSKAENVKTHFVKKKILLKFFLLLLNLSTFFYFLFHFFF